MLQSSNDKPKTWLKKLWGWQRQVKKTTDGATISVKHYRKHVWARPERQEHYERKLCPFELATEYYTAGVFKWLTKRNVSKTRDDKAIPLQNCSRPYRAIEDAPVNIQC